MAANHCGRFEAGMTGALGGGGAPAVRVRDRDAAARQKLAHLDQLVDDDLVGVAGLPFSFDDPLATEEGQVGAIAGIVEDVIRHLEPVLAPDLEVVVANGWGQCGQSPCLRRR